jgi:hypothetical protein
MVQTLVKDVQFATCLYSCHKKIYTKKHKVAYRPWYRGQSNEPQSALDQNTEGIVIKRLKMFFHLQSLYNIKWWSDSNLWKGKDE